MTLWYYRQSTVKQLILTVCCSLKRVGVVQIYFLKYNTKNINFFHKKCDETGV